MSKFMNEKKMCDKNNYGEKYIFNEKSKKKPREVFVDKHFFLLFSHFFFIFDETNRKKKKIMSNKWKKKTI